MPAFEIIDDRNADYKTLDAASILMDRCWCAGIVLGAAVTDWSSLDLAHLSATHYRNGVLSASSITEDKSSQKASLTPGQYQVFFSYNSTNASIDSLNIIAAKHHPMATGTVTANSAGDGSIVIDLAYWAYHPDSSLISIYENDTTTYNGKLIDHVSFGSVESNGTGVASYTHVPTNMNNGSSAYYYFVIKME